MDSHISGATETVRAAAEALETERWSDVAALVDPDSLEHFQKAQLGRLLEDERLAQSGDDETNPTLSAEHRARFQRAAQLSVPQLRQEWGVGSSFEELRGLSPSEFLVRYLAATSPAAIMRVTTAVAHPPALSRLGDLHKLQRRFVVLGEVREGRRAHVLYRELREYESYDPDAAMGPPLITEVRQTDGRWWLKLGDRSILERPAKITWAQYLPAT